MGSLFLFSKTLLQSELSLLVSKDCCFPSKPSFRRFKSAPLIYTHHDRLASLTNFHLMKASVFDSSWRGTVRLPVEGPFWRIQHDPPNMVTLRWREIANYNAGRRWLIFRKYSPSCRGFYAEILLRGTLTLEKMPNSKQVRKVSWISSSECLKWRARFYAHFSFFAFHCDFFSPF